MNIIPLLVAVLMATLLVTAPPQSISIKPAVDDNSLSRYQLVWHDEFGGTPSTLV